MSRRTKSTPSRPKVDLDATRERLGRLGLQHAAEQLEERLSATVKDAVSPHRFLDTLLDLELSCREEPDQLSLRPRLDPGHHQ